MDKKNYFENENNKSSNLNDKLVEEKGMGVNNFSDDIKGETDDIVNDLESTQKKKFTNKQRDLLEYIALQNYFNEGVNKKQIVSKFNCSIDYAEKIIYNLRIHKLIIPSGIREGHMMTYFLTNMQDHIKSKETSNRKVRIKSIDEYDIVNEDVIMIIFKELTNNNGLFHNFRLQTKLKDKGDYNVLSITTHSLWKLQSEKNKVKVAYTRISRHRTINLQVSPNGTVEIYISASRDPYDLHSDRGLSEFFVDLGKIESLFQNEFHFLDPLARFYDWHIIRVDYNHDIEGLSISRISDKTTILQVKHLSHLFQFYIKKLPHKGLIPRLEANLSFPKPYKTIKEFTDNL